MPSRPVDLRCAPPAGGLVGLLGACLLVTTTWSASAAVPSADDFATARPPVLGHLVQWNAETDVYRLVTSDDTDRVLAEGTLEECQAALVERLVERWGKGRPNLPLRTLGARQFWGDVFLHAGWRIQENVLTGHHRLLDEHDVRQAWGTEQACRAAFESLRAERGLEPSSEHLVLLLHGLGRGRSSLARMAEALASAGFEAETVAYPSTRRSLAEHADQLGRLLDRLEGPRKVSFVTHSLGGLVVRTALHQGGDWTERLTVGRLVMLAPPSTGSALADGLEGFLPVEALLGPVLSELTAREAKDVPLPTCEFGIVAAGRGSEEGLNPLLRGDDDGIVSVDETRLPGAADHLTVRGLHTFLMDDPVVVEATVAFLRSGRFSGAPEPDTIEDDAGG